MTFSNRAFAFRSSWLVFHSLVAMSLVHAFSPSAHAGVMGVATITTTQTSAPYTYSLALQNTGTLPIDTFWFAWLDSPEKNFMSAVPTNVQSPLSWVGIPSHLGTGDGYGLEYYVFGSSGLPARQTLTGVKFVSTESPSQLMGNVSVPGLGTLPVTTTFLYNGGAFSPNVAQIQSTVVPEPSTIVLGSLGTLALWFAWRRSAQARS